MFCVHLTFHNSDAFCRESWHANKAVHLPHEIDTKHAGLTIVCQELPALWQNLNKLLVKDTGYGSTGEGPVCSNNAIKLARLALLDELFPVLRLRLDKFCYI